MKDEKVTWLHLPKRIALEPAKNILQSEKWLHAMCKAPIWKKMEYAAQAAAWDEYETNFESFICPKWCNHFSRA